MLSKLLKYEFKATGRVILPLFGALLLLSVISRLFISLRFEAPMVIGIALTVIMIISIFVITFIITLQRFYKNLLTNEGYLMFTLPVSADQLIWSKLIAAFVWNLVSILVVGLAIVIMAVTEFRFSDIIREIVRFLQEVHIAGVQLGVYILEFILASVASLLSSILFFYGCMSCSLLFNKNRVLFSFVAFLVFYTVGQILSAIVVSIVMATGLPDFFAHMNPYAVIHTAQLGVLALNVLIGAFFYFLSRYMLKNKLNLE
jgi:hypothetical protein